ncbi:MAG: hypothetical protein WAT26_15255, partial [Saprospiraceae bacterium]
GKGSYLYINFEDDHLFKPGDSYFIIPVFNGIISEDVFNYFEAINTEFQKHGGDTFKIFNNSNTKHIKNIKKYETEILNIIRDSTNLGTMTSEFLTNIDSFRLFLNDTNFIITNKKIDTLKIVHKKFIDSIQVRYNRIISNAPNYNFLTNAQISNNTAIQDDVVMYLLGTNGEHNSFLNILNYSIENNIFRDILEGLVKTKCVTCKKIDATSLKSVDLEKRLVNMDTLFNDVMLIRSLIHLLKPKMNESEWRVEIIKIDNFLNQINKNKIELTDIISRRKEIDKVLFSRIFVGYGFFGLDILSGNSIMSFEARNKITLVPEFGIVTSAFNRKGKDLEYEIIPYIGFSINFMGINKDISFSSYTKDWKQRVSFGIGWSLVNLNKDAERASFFEKGSMLTGLGFRINNTIKATTGVQMYFDLSKDNLNNEIRKLAAVPYIGLSFDLSVKDFLGGFLDIIPGIGKSKNISSSNNNY